MKTWMREQDRARMLMVGLLPVMGCGLLGGCITLAAPDKPIVIELNINIQQEVVYRLDGDAKNLIEENEDIF